MTDKLPLADLSLFHKNPRRGNVDAIAASLRANGQFKPVVVNKGTHTGRPNEVLAGNHTTKAFRDLAAKYPDDPRWQEILVHIVDVDDDRAARIVAVDNRTSEVGTNDDRLLLELLAGLDDLDGTGYSDDDYTDLEDIVGGEQSLDELNDDVNDEPKWVVKAQLTPELFQRFEAVDGAGHAQKLHTLMVMADA